MKALRSLVSGSQGGVDLAECLPSVRQGKRGRGTGGDFATKLFATITSCNCLAHRIQARKETVLVACKTLSSICHDRISDMAL